MNVIKQFDSTLLIQLLSSALWLKKDIFVESWRWTESHFNQEPVWGLGTAEGTVDRIQETSASCSR